MYARDLSGTHVEMRCLRELVQHKLPRLAAHMDALACDMSILATGGLFVLLLLLLPVHAVCHSVLLACGMSIPAAAAATAAAAIDAVGLVTLLRTLQWRLWTAVCVVLSLFALARQCACWTEGTV